ncbi:S-adenosylmethionine decarboxylase proenzyme [candidate division FCPU426 bacterium]|nr:S-adenosylmethionine decarboxylase proenzyme [candidate division FCPU426 bacterium]
MKALGRHILLELHGCDSNILKDHEQIAEIMKSAALAAKATIVKSVFHHFNPYGVSGVVVIAESHLSIHTWPEHGFAALDFFTCGDEVDPWIAHHYVAEKLKAKSKKSIEIKRGVFDVAELKHKVVA